MISIYDDVVRSLTAGPERDGGVHRAEFVFRKDFSGFDGHFPGNPIVPGIAQMYAVQITAGAAQGGDERNMRLKEAVRCKFMRPVLPDEVVRVALSGEWEDCVLRCKADITAGDEPCASMTLLLERAE